MHLRTFIGFFFLHLLINTTTTERRTKESMFRSIKTYVHQFNMKVLREDFQVNTFEKLKKKSVDKSKWRWWKWTETSPWRHHSLLFRDLVSSISPKHGSRARVRPLLEQRSSRCGVCSCLGLVPFGQTTRPRAPVKINVCFNKCTIAISSNKFAEWLFLPGVRDNGQRFNDSSCNESWAAWSVAQPSSDDGEIKPDVITVMCVKEWGCNKR